MSVIKPFRGLRPVQEKASAVASPPYDVLSSEEARQMARDNPISFLRVVKPEIDLDAGVDVHSEVVYEKGYKNLTGMIDKGVMVRDETPCLYLYEQRMQIAGKTHVQVGLVAGVSVDEYQEGVIKKHEFTRPDKEADRTRHIEHLKANTGPVFLTYRSSTKIDGLVETLCAELPINDFVADDGIGHRFWVVDDPSSIENLVDAFQEVPCLYIADGHHRSASASNVRENLKKANPAHRGDEPYNYFLAVIFPDNRMHIMDYNRVVADLNGKSPESLKKDILKAFELAPTDAPSPSRATEFGMYLDGSWYRLKAKSGTFDPEDPVQSLDVAILQNNLLSPLLGIDDPRRDTRIDFVGGIRGSRELERRADATGGVAFAMFPTSIEQLMAIADAGEVMPPKSTWFEPKLRSGLVVRLLDSE
jgi:uncharacterized protein (DUF1015 family)